MTPSQREAQRIRDLPIDTESMLRWLEQEIALQQIVRMKDYPLNPVHIAGSERAEAIARAIQDLIRQTAAQPARATPEGSGGSEPD